jgi:phosphatidylethanolamine-binding protein (PEBP) family uncharacterized protein
MHHSSRHSLYLARYALPACVAVTVACGQPTTGPEGSPSGETSSTATPSSSSTSNVVTTATGGTSTAPTAGTSGQTASSNGASGQSGTSSAATGQSGTSSSTSGQTATTNGTSTQSPSAGESSSSTADSSSVSAESATSTEVASESSATSETSATSSGEFTLTSSAHEDGSAFDDKYTCASMNGQFGTGVIPPLAWANAPSETLSFAITFIDTKVLEDDSIPDSQAYHWAMWDIPADVMAIMEDGEAAIEGTQEASPVGGFFPPCPGGRDDTYAFTIYAIPSATLGHSGTDVKAAETAIKAAAIGEATLTGTSNAGG